MLAFVAPVLVGAGLLSPADDVVFQLSMFDDTFSIYKASSCARRSLLFVVRCACGFVRAFGRLA